MFRGTFEYSIQRYYAIKTEVLVTKFHFPLTEIDFLLTEILYSQMFVGLIFVVCAEMSFKTIFCEYRQAIIFWGSKKLKVCKDLDTQSGFSLRYAFHGFSSRHPLFIRLIIHPLYFSHSKTGTVDKARGLKKRSYLLRYNGRHVYKTIPDFLSVFESHWKRKRVCKDLVCWIQKTKHIGLVSFARNNTIFQTILSAIAWRLYLLFIFLTGDSN